LLAQLRVLDLAHNQLGDRGCTELAPFLQQMNALRVLGLANNGIGADGARALFHQSLAGSCGWKGTAAVDPGVALQRPADQGTGWQCDQTLLAADQGPGRCDQTLLAALSVLQLGGNVLGDGGLAALAAALPSWPQLQVLELQENYNISSNSMPLLGAALRHTSSLVHLNLSKNSIGPHGAKHIAEGLKANAAAALAHLGGGGGATATPSEVAAVAAGENHLVSPPPEGMALMSSTPMATFVGLQQLDLERCKLKAEGVEHLAAALMVGPGSIEGNSCGAVGGSTQPAPLHCCLKHLGLSRNGAGDKGVKVGREQTYSPTVASSAKTTPGIQCRGAMLVMSQLVRMQGSGFRVQGPGCTIRQCSVGQPDVCDLPATTA
jgi:hypothetical protein